MLLCENQLGLCSLTALWFLANDLVPGVTSGAALCVWRLDPAIQIAIVSVRPIRQVYDESTSPNLATS